MHKLIVIRQKTTEAIEGKQYFLKQQFDNLYYDTDEENKLIAYYLIIDGEMSDYYHLPRE
jgi:hypothetical protein